MPPVGHVRCMKARDGDWPGRPARSTAGVANFDMDLSTIPDALGTLVLDSDTFGVISVRECLIHLVNWGSGEVLFG